MSCDKKVPRQALGGELGLADNFPSSATVIRNAAKATVARLKIALALAELCDRLAV
jgi:hypothetical protein